MMNLLAIATRGRISPPGNAPNLVAIATRGFVVPSGGPVPEPEPAVRIIASFRLGRGEAVAFQLDRGGEGAAFQLDRGIAPAFRLNSSEDS